MLISCQLLKNKADTFAPLFEKVHRTPGSFKLAFAKARKAAVESERA